MVWTSRTDVPVIALGENPDTVSFLQTVKGWLFVLLSAGLIVGPTQLRANRIALTHAKLKRTSEQLQARHRVLRHNLRNDLT